MNDTPQWIPNAESTSLRNWTDYLRTEAKRLLIQDGTHACLLFLFNKENGLISINQVPPDVDLNQLNEVIVDTINEHSLYGVVVISETWVYFAKENDHTAFQLLDGEMKVSELNDEDKKEALMVRMENRDGDRIAYYDQILRDKNGGVTFKEGSVAKSLKAAWFIAQEPCSGCKHD